MAFGNFFDDILGMDPNGKGSAGLWNVLIGGGGMPPGVNPKDMQRLIEEFAKGQAEAKAANEARYGEIKGNYKGAIRQSKRDQRADVQFLQGQRKEMVQQTREGFNNLQTQNEQDLLSRGLSNTTVLPTLRMGMEGERRRAVTDVRNTANRAILSTQQAGRARTDAFRTGMLGFKERREDAYPDMNQLVGLAQAYGNAAGADRQNALAALQGGLAGIMGRQSVPGLPGSQYPGLMGGPGLFGAQPQQQPQQQQGGLLGKLFGLFF
jgi:hypothetical protein